MPRRFAPNLLACVALMAAFVVTFCAPRRAFATILPACESHVLATEVAPPALPEADGAETAEPKPSACRSALDERAPEGDTRFSPMCDARGASTEAPPRIHAIGDERLEAVPSCEHGLSSPTAIGPSPRELPAQSDGVALADHAVLPPLFVLPAPLGAAAPDFLPLPDEARPGERQRIDHPPR